MTDSHGPEPGWLDLADAIALLRAQIAEAQRRISSPSGPGDRGVLFTLGEITVELGLELTGVQGIEGGLRWSVISLGGKKETGRTATHTVTVKLQPHQPGSGDINVRDTE